MQGFGFLFGGWYDLIFTGKKEVLLFIKTSKWYDRCGKYRKYEASGAKMMGLKELTQQFKAILTDLKSLPKKDQVKLVETMKKQLGKTNEGKDLPHTQLSFERAMDIVNTTKVVVLEWTLSPDVPTKFVTDNIVQFGYQPEDFYTGPMQDYWSFIHPDDREVAKDNVYAARKLGLNEFVHGYRVLTKDGRVRWVEERIIFEKDKKGHLTSEKGVLIDITDRKLLELKLMQSKSRYQRLYENAAVMMFTLFPDGHMLSCNRKTAEIFGVSQQALLKHNFLNWMTPACRKQFIPVDFSRYCSDDGEKALEIEVVNAQGDVLVLSVLLSCQTMSEKALCIEAIAQDITEVKKKEKHIAYLSYHDKLTGAFNRAYFDDKAQQLQKAQAFPLSIIMGDLNGLKDVNDLLGHQAGDQLLKETAKILRKSCRDTDIISRYGGDEFAVLLPHADQDVAERVIKSIREACELNQDSMLAPSISIGYATKYTDEERLESLFKEADDMMYADKLNQLKHKRFLFSDALESAIKRESPQARAHGERVRKLAISIAKELKFTQKQITRLGVVAALHDIGKIGLPADILNKRGPYTQEEYQVMQSHVDLGARILKTSQHDMSLADDVKYHHEWYNGKGYPEGLKGENIPLMSRVIAVADAYDAMIQSRQYKPSMTPESAVAELNKYAATQFDPVMVKAMQKIVQHSTSITAMHANKKV